MSFYAHYPPADSSGGGANVTIVGPLGSQASASSVSVAIASDQTLPLPTGAATAAKQDTGNTSLASIDTKVPAKGQTTLSGSMPVAIASDQTLPLPTGAATAAKQDTGNTSLASLDTKLPVKGQAAMAASTPVALASDQTAIPVSNATLAISGSGSQAQATPIAATDVSAYSSVTIQISGTFNASTVFEGSNDNVTYFSTQAVSINNVQALTTSAASPGLWIIPIYAKYFRARISSYTSGTVTATAVAATLASEVFPILPVSQNGTWNITNVSGTVSLPTGASTAAKQAAPGTAGTASADVITVQGITSMTPLKVDGSGSTQPISGTVAATQSGAWNITNVSGTVSLPTGASTESTLSTLSGKIPSNLTVTSTRLLVDASGTTQPVSGTVAATQSGTWTVQPGNTANTTAWLMDRPPASTSTVTSVVSANTTTSLLASNASRKNATFYNDSTQIAYIKLGATASTSSYTVQLIAGGYYELPIGNVYTGAIDCIWAAANGNMRITELT